MGLNDVNDGPFVWLVAENCGCFTLSEWATRFVPEPHAACLASSGLLAIHQAGRWPLAIDCEDTHAWRLNGIVAS